MDSDIIIKEKPDTLSWVEISQVLRAAHQGNLDKGVYMPYPFLPPDELQKLVEEGDGTLFVAYYQNRLVGTGAVIFREKRFWFGSETFAYNCLGAVLPECNGKGVYRALALVREKYALNAGFDKIIFSTNEKNIRIINIARQSGFELVDYSIHDKRNSVVMLKWLKKKPFSHLHCYFMFLKIKYKKLIKQTIRYFISPL